MTDNPWIEFVVPGAPVPQPRHRHSGKSFGRGAKSYIPSDHAVHAYKDHVRLAVMQAWRGRAMRGGIELEAEFVFARPKSAGCGDRLPHTVRPDVDNLQKALMDALNEVAWLDDSQVCSVGSRKWVAATGEKPHVRFRIRPLP